MNTPARTIAGLVLLALTLAGCSGGGSAGTSLAPGSTSAQQTVQQVSGTLSIGTPSGSSTSSLKRSPEYVSASTTHAYIFINGSATPANASSTCGPAAGTSGVNATTYCTITWSTALAVPASYNFQVETDNGTKVLAEGSVTEALVAGVNTLGTLTLNGVVNNATFTTASCTAGVAGTTAGTCNGTVSLSSNALDAITYNGSLTTVNAGLNPTTGTVFDNGNVTLVSSSANGLVTGTAQTVGAYVYSTFGANTLTVSGVSPTGAYTFAVKCATATTTGAFSITVGGGASQASGVNILNSTLTGIGTTYVNSVSTVAPGASYTCTNGVISSATGTLPVN
jgi:hypothetical protein